MKRIPVLVVGAALLLGLATPLQAQAAQPHATDGAIINYSCGPAYKVQTGRMWFSEFTKKIGSAKVGLEYQGRGSDNVWFAEIWNARAGDKVWLDWADHSKARYHLCGPYKVASGKTMRWTRAVNLVDGRYVRACGRHSGTTKCTGWFPKY
ncbi:hypothetical protein [Streptomyces galbus]|uniref:Secreted protein n=1 Tax=Streptomyces galbus TaxID=33898 RepID=A0ABX1IRG5_STRGB|nr:hypothetical protein [Streptomyces galbus]NKQ28218.1 hypothetical protein [Streptomyces galbus]